MTKKGASAASTDDVVMSVNERILRDCHNLYTDPKDGLILIARDVDIELLPPRKKINVLLIGIWHKLNIYYVIYILHYNLLLFIKYYN